MPQYINEFIKEIRGNNPFATECSLEVNLKANKYLIKIVGDVIPIAEKK